MTARWRVGAALLFMGAAYGWWVPAAPMRVWWLGAWAAASLVALWLMWPTRQVEPDVSPSPVTPAARLAHDVRTPLMRLGLRVDGLRSLDGVPEEWVDEMAALVGQLGRLAEDVLVMAGAEEEAPMGAIRLDAWIRTAVPPFEELFQSYGCPLSLEVAPAPAVAVPADRMLSVLQNLLGNALMHGLSRTPVRVRVSEDGPLWVSLEVENASDEPRDPPESLVGPFRRGHVEVPGYGLGLAVTDRIAAAAGGRIHVEWAEGLWTTRVLLPRWREDGGSR